MTPGEEVAVEVTVHTSFVYDLKLAVRTLDTASRYHLELHDEDNMVIIPVPT